jgi:predicted Rossmann fold nucleotide-binding protein DprA/Smf involved in DNA uptake
LNNSPSLWRRQVGVTGFVLKPCQPWKRAISLHRPPRQFINGKPSGAPEKEVNAIRRIGCLNCTEPEYPQLLLQVYDPPALLYVRGDVSVLNAPSYASLARAAQQSMGAQLAERLGRDLAKRGLVILSGLARGVDAFSTQAPRLSGPRP